MIVQRNGSAPGKHRYAAPRPTLAEMMASAEDFNRAGTNFLKVDLATALIFVDIALTTNDPAKKLRNRKSARKAYDTVTKQMTKVRPSDRDIGELHANLDRLRSELRRLGEVF